MRWQSCTAGEKGKMCYLHGGGGRNGLFLGLKRASINLSTYLGDERNILLIAKVNRAVAGPTNRSGNHGCQGLASLV